MGTTSAPGGGIAPEAQASGAITPTPTHGPAMQDRGLYHASDAMRSMYEMGDAPSCSTCGAIMVRNGSCYRCMSCGSTSRMFIEYFYLLLLEQRGSLPQFSCLTWM